MNWDASAFAGKREKCVTFAVQMKWLKRGGTKLKLRDKIQFELLLSVCIFKNIFPS